MTFTGSEHDNEKIKIVDNDPDGEHELTKLNISVEDIYDVLESHGATCAVCGSPVRHGCLGCQS